MTETAISVGDPDGMRDLARALISRADALSANIGKVTGDVRSAVFEGPAADRVRGAVEDARSQAMGAVDQLREAASSLYRDAIEVERQNDALRAAALAREAAAEEAAAAAQAALDAPAADAPAADVAVPAPEASTPESGAFAGAVGTGESE